MSDAPQGPGWWQASDLKWYPPQPPSSLVPPPPAPPAPPGPPALQYGYDQQPPAYGAPLGYAQPPAPTPPPSTGSRVGVMILIGVLVGVIVAIAAFAASSLGDDDADDVASRTSVPVIKLPTSIGGPPTTGGGSASRGTREAPLPLGTEVDLGNGWHVKVVSADTSEAATATVVDSNEFNDAPDPGLRYVIVNVSMSYDGANGPTESPFLGTTISLFGSANVQRQSSDSFALAPDPQLDPINELAAGGVASGNIVIAVGADETDLVLRVEPGFSFEDSDDAWLALG